MKERLIEANYQNGLEPYPNVQPLNDWLNDEVSKVKNRSIKFLSEQYFHRVEARPAYLDSRYFFTPADGVIMYSNEKVNAANNIIEVKGCNFTLKELFQDDSLEGDFLIVSIFMTFFSQHQNYIPFAGNRTYEELPPVSSFNKPMLAVEKDLLNGVINPEFQEEYLRKNNREISEIYSHKIDQEYFILRFGDYDVDTMVNWKQKDGSESTPVSQNERFGMITYGSQCILAIPLYEGGYKFKLRKEAQVANYTKCRRTPLVEVLYDQHYQKGEVQHLED